MVCGCDGLAGFNSGRFRSTPRGGIDSSPHAEPTPIPEPVQLDSRYFELITVKYYLNTCLFLLRPINPNIQTMKKQWIKTSLVACVGMALLSSTQAAVITAAGFVEGAQVTDWRTDTTDKSTFDIDGDNVFGTFGSVQWNVGDTNQHTGTTPGWSYISSGTGYQFSKYTDIDSVITGDTDGSIALLSFKFRLTGIPQTYAGMTVRVGIMQDLLGADERDNDIGKTLQLVQLSGAGAGASSVVSVRSGGGGDSVPEMYFFDMTGVNPADTFEILAPAGGGATGYVGPVSWDIAAVPEPSSAAAILGLVGVALVLRRRR